jgi:hypothetical protein
LDGAARAQFRLDAQIANAQINDEVGGDFMRPKECFDCECLYADLNEYLVYRRRKVQPWIALREVAFRGGAKRRLSKETTMKAKALELRDKGTFIAILCVDMNPGIYRDDEPGMSKEYDAQCYLLRRCGYPCDGRPNIIMTRLNGNGQATNDPYGWKGVTRIFPVAHKWIIDNWHTLNDGDVVDVQFILGETSTPKQSERITAPL